MEQITIRQVTNPDDPAIAAFGRVQERTFADPDLLIPPAVMPAMLANQTSARRNLLLVAERAENVLGGTLFHYLAVPNSGFSSFLAVAPEARRLGLARRLHEARLRLLDQVAGRPVAGLFIDVEAPERMTPEARQREIDFGIDPTERRRIFHRLGFRRVDVAYYQPPTRPGDEPLTVLDLLFCPREPSERVARELVVETMRAYWTPWLGKAAADHHAARLHHLCGGDWVALQPAD